MLGNWSFGDYFKEEAILWAWELMTENLETSKEKLWATVLKEVGGKIQADTEAEHFWKTQTDIQPHQILRCSKKDNFWEMGDVGPCGPCTGIHIDLGEEELVRLIMNVGSM